MTVIVIRHGTRGVYFGHTVLLTWIVGGEPRAHYNHSSPMPRKFPQTVVLTIFLVLASAAYWAGVPDVPFHPDESTQIFMSRDVEIFFSDPAALAWRADAVGDLRQHYRLMDAPLPRAWIGLARLVAGQPANRADWDWSVTWQQNVARGALPSPATLFSARLAMALFFPFTLLLTFRTGMLLAGQAAGWTALLLMASHALVLLHTRRAMAEGILLFMVTLSLWCILRGGRRPWLAALPLALAFLSKQSAAALLVPAGLALLTPLGGERRWPARWKNTLIAAILFLLVVVLFNPFVWSHLLEALQAATRERAAFTQAQLEAHTQRGGALLAESLPERLVGIVAQLYITPPALMDVANYRAELAESTERYLANPLHNLLRGFGGGGVLLLYSLFGLLAAGMRAIRQRDKAKPVLALFAVAGLAQAAVLLLVPVPFQRYAVILVPHAVLWIGVGMAYVGEAIFSYGKRGDSYMEPPRP